MSAKDVMTVRVDPKIKRSLEKIARATDRDRSAVVNNALEAYVELYRWQIDHVNEGLRQADAGDFATQEEVDAFFGRIRKRK
jgi:predicted transcriptional regulator